MARWSSSGVCRLNNIMFVIIVLFSSYATYSSSDGVTLVSRDGEGDYATISEAIAEAPTHLTHTKYIIHLRPGIYHEYLTIPPNKTNIFLIGQGPHNTKIVGNRSASNPPFILSRTATVAIEGAGFVAQGIAFVNWAGPKAGQGIALLNEGDESAFYKCSFEGFQDTLWASTGRQFYRECDVYGSVDFVMGNAAAVFQNCALYARFRKHAVFTAQSRDNPLEATGFVFQNCRFTVSPEERELWGVGGSILGRPWRAYSRVVILRSYIDSIVSPSGWGEMEGTPTDKATYVEYGNEGPGSDTRGRVRWPGVMEVHDVEAVRGFAASNFLEADTWIPNTGVPYLGRLL
ncbi:putative pectinesterase/pectinesterase inhibitor 22 [Senna tora]|uniref:pectinesterase n=1 Tax=Senna tora TaxID=362788 RepID=A0A834X2R8_9FABA|nr:putative pectinesterase/pectinesterase inhibitor 22 [Senna tora]